MGNQLVACDYAGCTGHDIPNQGDYHSVEDMWRIYFGLGGYISWHSILVAREGDTILAGYNYSWLYNWSFSEDIIDYFNREMDGLCVAWRPGWLHLDHSNVSFWRDGADVEICGNL
jgi:hypothetical protein